MSTQAEHEDHVGPLCPECSDDPDTWQLDAPEGIPSVYWVDEDGNEVHDVPQHHDPSQHPDLTKMVFRECPECYFCWTYEVA